MRRPAVQAGRFYPADADECRRFVAGALVGFTPQEAIGAVVPHAGWVFSGKTAAKSWACIAAYRPETVVIFGAVHGPDANPASVFGAGDWETPLGPVAIDEAAAQAILSPGRIVDDPWAHRREHAIEVQLPILRALLPDCRILPIGVRPDRGAAAIGEHCVAAMRRIGRRAAYVGSTDLTHYGPNFGFEPQGRGEPGLAWAKDVNDRRFIGHIQRMDAGAVLADAEHNRSACGSGAVAAAIGAMLALGLREYVELEHVSSAEIAAGWDPEPENGVGYEAGIFPPSRST
jgi:MEMO1 family protein